MSLPSNPFCTRFVRPGGAPFLFSGDVTITDVAEKWRGLGRMGVIVGPHGSGKSTLWEELVGVLGATGQTIRKIRLHEGERRLPTEFLLPGSPGEETVLAIDGLEQLGWRGRRGIARFCRAGGGLLATSHQEGRWPTLWRTEPSLHLAMALVRRLAPDSTWIREDDLRGVFERSGGDVRETLFAAYDLVEARRRGAVEWRAGL